MTKNVSDWFLCFLLAGIFVFSRGFFTFFIGGGANFFVLLGFLVPLIFLINRGYFKTWRLNAMNIMVFMYLLHLAIMSLFARELERGLIGFFLLGFPFVLYLLGICFQFEKGSYKQIHKLIFYFWAYLTFFALVEIIFDIPLSALKQYGSTPALSKIYAPFRISSSIGSTLPFGLVYCYFTIYFLLRFFYLPSIKNFLFVSLSLFIIFGTYNRSVLGMLIFSMGLFFTRYFLSLCVRPLRKADFRLLVLLSISFILLIVVLPYPVIFRFYQMFDWQRESSNLLRMRIWRDTIAAFQDNYEMFFGISVGATGNILKYFNLPGLTGKSSITESYYLKLLVETGIIGLSLFLGMIIAFLGACFSFKIDHKKPQEAIIKNYLFLNLAAHGIQLFFLQSLESTAVAFIFFFNLALIQRIYVFEKMK